MSISIVNWELVEALPALRGEISLSILPSKKEFTLTSQRKAVTFENTLITTQVTLKNYSYSEELDPEIKSGFICSFNKSDLIDSLKALRVFLDFETIVKIYLEQDLVFVEPLSDYGLLPYRFFNPCSTTQEPV